MLDQVLAARPFLQHGGLQLARHIQLVVAGKDDPLHQFLLVALRDDVTAQNLQPAFPRPDLFPQVRRAVPAIGVHRVARPAVITLIERQKEGFLPFQPGGHLHLAVADGEMNQRAVGKRQQLFRFLPLGARVPVVPVLEHRVLNALREVGFQFRRGHGNAVEEKNQVDAVLVVWRVAHLAHHPQPVGGVPGQNFRSGERGLEDGKLKRGLQAHQLHPVAQNIDGAALVDLVAYPFQQGGLGGLSVVFLQRFPCLGLAHLHPFDQVGGE